jgi:hypothetical protein
VGLARKNPTGEPHSLGARSFDQQSLVLHRSGPAINAKDSTLLKTQVDDHESGRLSSGNPLGVKIRPFFVQDESCSSGCFPVGRAALGERSSTAASGGLGPNEGRHPLALHWKKASIEGG